MRSTTFTITRDEQCLSPNIRVESTNSVVFVSKYLIALEEEAHTEEEVANREILSVVFIAKKTYSNKHILTKYYICCL